MGHGHPRAHPRGGRALRTQGRRGVEDTGALCGRPRDKCQGLPRRRDSREVLCITVISQEVWIRTCFTVTAPGREDSPARWPLTRSASAGRQPQAAVAGFPPRGAAVAHRGAARGVPGEVGPRPASATVTSSGNRAKATDPPCLCAQRPRPLPGKAAGGGTSAPLCEEAFLPRSLGGAERGDPHRTDAHGWRRPHPHGEAHRTRTQVPGRTLCWGWVRPGARKATGAEQHTTRFPETRRNSITRVESKNRVCPRSGERRGREGRGRPCDTMKSFLPPVSTLGGVPRMPPPPDARGA